MPDIPVIRIGHLKITDHLVLGITADKIRSGVETFTRSDGALIALFGDKWKLQFIEKEHPEFTLETLVAD